MPRKKVVEEDAPPVQVEAPEQAEAAAPTEMDPRDMVALDVLAEICASTGLDMSPRLGSVEGAYLHIELVGDDAARIFGRNGRMLDALQYLANLVVVRKAGPGVRLLLDAGGYRERRANVLRNLALEYAEQVKARQEECELDALPPHERRLIHQFLAEDSAVTTYSEGEEPERHVVIAPR